MENNWETLVADEDYEINTEYPYQIRRKKNGKTVSEYEEKNGYIRLTLNGKKYLKHRFIAIQWIDNPDSFGEVGHYDKVRNNNMVDNLHWCSSSTNNRNRSKANGVEYNFVDEISENSITVSHYGIMNLRIYFTTSMQICFIIITVVSIKNYTLMKT